MKKTKPAQKKRLVRPKTGKVFAGVAAGIANYLGMDVTLVRFIWIVLLLPGGLPGFIPYVILAFIMPEEE